MVLGGAAFGRQLGHKSGVLRNGIDALIKETPESSLDFLLCEDTVFYELESGSSANTKSAGSSISFFPAFRTLRNKCLLFKLPIYGNLLWQLKLTKAPTLLLIDKISY